MNITIKYLNDSSDCDTCGLSWAEGFLVTFEDGTKIDMTPYSGCCSSTNYSENDLIRAVLTQLGHTVVFEPPDEIEYPEYTDTADEGYDD